MYIVYLTALAKLALSVRLQSNAGVGTTLLYRFHMFSSSSYQGVILSIINEKINNFIFID